MPKLLDLFCKAGGAAKGYTDAGFDVVGVDIKNQKRYPFEFIQADALEVLQDNTFIDQFDFIHASPPCQTHSSTKHLRQAQGRTTSQIDLIPQTRSSLEDVLNRNRLIGYVIENVQGAPLINPITLCGSYFGLGVRRHRLFESNLKLKGTNCRHEEQGRPIGVYGSMRDNIPSGGRTAHTMEEASNAMGIDWMIWTELVEAIPPAYTSHIGDQMLWIY